MENACGQVMLFSIPSALNACSILSASMVTLCCVLLHSVYESTISGTRTLSLACKHVFEELWRVLLIPVVRMNRPDPADWHPRGGMVTYYGLWGNGNFRKILITDHPIVPRVEDPQHPPRGCRISSETSQKKSHQDLQLWWRRTGESCHWKTQRSLKKFLGKRSLNRPAPQTGA